MQETKGLLKYSGSKNWYLRFYDSEGKRRTVSLGTDDLVVALQKKRALLGGHLISTQQAVMPRTGIHKHITEYLRVSQERAKKSLRPHTAKRRRYVIEMFARERNIEFVGQIDHREVSSWILSVRDRCGKETVHTYARTLKTFLAYLVSLKAIRPEVAQDLVVPERGAHGRKNWLKNEVVRRVISESKNETLTFILYCGFHCGLRRNEIANAKVHWFDLEAGVVHVQNDEDSGFVLKNRKNRTVKLTVPFQKFLNTFLANRDVNEFAIRPNKAQGSWRYRYDFDQMFSTHIRKCGVRCSIHDMRRSFASNLVSAGESIYIVAKWLGDGVQVVERSYGHLAPEAGNVNRLVC